MPYLNAVLATAAAVLVPLIAVYVWSSDAGRRGRAWRVLRLLLRRGRG
jgi:hypothetical protein